MEKLTPHKQTTFMRELLEVALKLPATLRFLATGNSYPSLRYSFKVDLKQLQSVRWCTAQPSFIVRPRRWLVVNWHMVSFHDTLWHAPSRSVGAKFEQCSRMVQASGMKVMSATNFELFKILSTTWNAHPHTSRTVHAAFRRLYATARPEACLWGDKMRASVNVALD